MSDNQRSSCPVYERRTQARLSLGRTSSLSRHPRCLWLRGEDEPLADRHLFETGRDLGCDRVVRRALVQAAVAASLRSRMTSLSKQKSPGLGATRALSDFGVTGSLIWALPAFSAAVRAAATVHGGMSYGLRGHRGCGPASSEDGHILSGGGVTAGNPSSVLPYREMRGRAQRKWSNSAWEYAPQRRFNSVKDARTGAGRKIGGGERASTCTRAALKRRCAPRRLGRSLIAW